MFLVVLCFGLIPILCGTNLTGLLKVPPHQTPVAKCPLRCNRVGLRDWLHGVWFFLWSCLSGRVWSLLMRCQRTMVVRWNGFPWIWQESSPVGKRKFWLGIFGNRLIVGCLIEFGTGALTELSNISVRCEDILDSALNKFNWSTCKISIMGNMGIAEKGILCNMQYWYRCVHRCPEWSPQHFTVGF